MIIQTMLFTLNTEKNNYKKTQQL